MPTGNARSQTGDGWKRDSSIYRQTLFLDTPILLCLILASAKLSRGQAWRKMIFKGPWTCWFSKLSPSERVARLWDCAACSEGIGRIAARGGRVTLSRASSHRAKWMDSFSVGDDGDKPEGEILQADRCWTKAVAGSGRELRTIGERYPRHIAVRVR